MSKSLMVVARPSDERKDIVAELKTQSHTVVEANDGGSAMELIRVIQPAVLIMDIDLPNLDGLSVLKALRASSVTRSLPVVLIGASERAAVRSSVSTLGVIDYLVRPFTAQDVALRVKWAFRESSTVPAVPWNMTDINLSHFLVDPVEKSAAPPETTPYIVSAYEGLLEGAGALPGASLSMMTPEVGGAVETGDGSVRVEVPPGSVRRAMSLGAARMAPQSPRLSESVRVRMGRRVADLTFVDQTGSPVSGARLDRPVKLAIRYDERDIAEAGDVENLAIQRFNPVTEQWTDLSSSLDLKNQRSVVWEKNFDTARKILGGRVLIAEADGTERDQLVDAVEGAGFTVILEPDGLAVARQVSRDQPDVVLMDLALPRLDGIQVLRQIKGEPATRSASVILFGDSEEQNLQSVLLSMGVRELIVKPWQPGDVQNRVRRAFEASRATRGAQLRAVERVKARRARQVRQQLRRGGGNRSRRAS